MTFSITPLLTGVRNPDQGIITYQKGYGKAIWLPIWSFLLKGESQCLLVDTGLDENELYTPPDFTKETGMEPLSLRECLRNENVRLDDIDIIINTHLHDDHCGNNSLFTGATFYAHKMEIAFCNEPHPLDHRYDNYFIEGIEFLEIEHRQQVVPGVEVLHSPGHTPGCLSVVVETTKGKAVITGFCCNQENFPDNGPAICPGVHLDAMAAWNSIQQIKNLDMILLPMHDLGLTKIGE